MSYPAQPYYPPPMPPAPQHNGFGTAALILGIIGAILGLIPILGLFAIILGLLALIFGLSGWSRARARRATNRGMAITGTILGPIALALGIWGMVIVGQVADDLRDNLDELDRQLSSIPAPPPMPMPT